MLCNKCGKDAGDKIICANCITKEPAQQPARYSESQAAPKESHASKIVVGIVGILFSCLAILNSGGTAGSPFFVKSHKEAMEKSLQSFKSSEDPEMRKQAELMENQAKEIYKSLEFTTFSKYACVAIGVLGVIIAFVYLFSCILILSNRISGLKCFYAAFSFGIALSVSKILVGCFSSSFILKAFIPYSVMGIIFHLSIFYLVYLNSSKWKLR